MSIVDRYHNSRQGQAKATNPAQGNFDSALKYFNDRLGHTHTDMSDSNLRKRGESVVDWERRLRDADRGRGSAEYEPLYAHQYIKAQNDEYTEEIKRTEDIVSTHQTHESTGPGSVADYLQWTSGEAEAASGGEQHTVNVNVDEGVLQQAVRQSLFTEAEANKIRQSGSVGLSSSDFSGIPAED